MTGVVRFADWARRDNGTAESKKSAITLENKLKITEGVSGLGLLTHETSSRRHVFARPAHSGLV